MIGWLDDGGWGRVAASWKCGRVSTTDSFQWTQYKNIGLKTNYWLYGSKTSKFNGLGCHDCGHFKRLTPLVTAFRLQLKCDGTRWRTEGEAKGKLANGVGSHYPSHYLGTWCIQDYYQQQELMRTTRLPVVDWTDVPADLNGLVRFAERRNLFSARMPSYFN